MKIANFIAKLFGNRNERQNSPDPETSAGAVNISAPIVRQKTELTNPIISGDEPMPSPQIQTLGGTVPDVPNNIASLPASQLPLGSSDPQNIAPTVAPRPVTEAEPLAEVTPRFGSPEYQKTRDEIDRLQKKDYSLKKDENGNVIHRGKDRDADHNWWDSVKGAGIGALKGYLSTGNVGGALGGAVTGGIQGAVDRNYDEKFVNNWKIQQQQQKAAEIFKRDRAEQDWLFNEEARKRKALQDEIEMSGKILDNKGKIQDQTIKYADALRSAIDADKQVTKAEADLFKQVTGMPIVEYDARKFNTQEVEGRVYASPELGAPQFKEVKTLPIDRGKVPVEFQVGNDPNNKLPLTPNQIAPIIANAEERANNRQFQIDLKNSDIENDNRKAQDETAQERAKAQAERDNWLSASNMTASQVAGLVDQLNAMSQELALMPEYAPVETGEKDRKGNPKTELRPSRAYAELAARIKSKQEELAKTKAANTEAVNKAAAAEKLMALPAPTQRKPISVPNVRKIKPVNEKTFRARSQARGINGENLERAVKKAKEDGVIR